TLTINPKEANPTSIPMLLRDSLIAVWFILKTEEIRSLAETSVGIDADRAASEEMAEIDMITLATRNIPPAMSIA
ncbi:MAG TPA: hypothetical protein VE130_11850, partial [Nitrososphaeraceae archaeon]|nr:hypothetical protein [Nitrososphaeraceae archaeon]